jgi:RNA polymerase sigma-B factor
MSVSLATAPPGSPPRLPDRDPREHERALLVRYHLMGDLAAREELVRRLMPLVRELALRYSYTDEPLDDLLQVGAVGLLKAIDRFEPGRGSKFTSYAAPTILGELKRHFRDKGWAVRVPRDLQELAVKLEPVSEDLLHELGRAPTIAEMAQRMGTSTEMVMEAREAASAYRAVSLDRPRDDDDGAEPLGVVVGVEDPGFGLAEDAATVGRLMHVLSEREREVLRLRFAEDLTQAEIGERVGVSQMHVSRIIRQAVARLREAAEA